MKPIKEVIKRCWCGNEVEHPFYTDKCMEHIRKHYM